METVKAPLFNRLWFFAVLGMLVIQYAKPQLIIPPLEYIRPFFLSAMIVTLFLIISRRNILQLGHFQMKLLWLTIGLYALMVPFSFNQGIAFMTLRNVLIFFPFILSILILVDNEKTLKTLIQTIVLIGLFNTIHGLIMHDGAGRNSMFNLGNFMTDPNEFSLYMNMMIPFAYFMFMYERKWNVWKLTYLITTILMVLAIIASYSRGGLVGLICISFVIWLYSPNKKLTAGLAIVGIICILAFSAATWKESMATTTDMSNGTVKTRLIAWIGSVNIFIDYPLGIGPGNTPFRLNDYVPYHGTNHWYGSQNHSVWLTALVEGGIIGFSIFLLLIYVNFKDLLNIKRVGEGDFMSFFAPACLGSLVGYFSSGTFLTVNYYPHYWYLTAIIAAGSRIAYERRVK